LVRSRHGVKHSVEVGLTQFLEGASHRNHAPRAARLWVDFQSAERIVCRRDRKLLRWGRLHDRLARSEVSGSGITANEGPESNAQAT
jgi:hypothetical protein